MSHPLDVDALYLCDCGEWHYKHECHFPPCKKKTMEPIKGRKVKKPDRRQAPRRRDDKRKAMLKLRTIKIPPNNVCMCDKPTCESFPCKDLREYRITYRVISEVLEMFPNMTAVTDFLDHIESECEILVK